MRRPEFLKPDGTIGFIAPAFGCAIEPYKTAFAEAHKKLSDKGYALKDGPNVYRSDGVGISAHPKACAKELMDAYEDPEMDVLMSCGGGELMCEIIPHVDFGRIAELPPKWFMGYSDNTNFTFLSATLADTMSVYGPCAPAFGMDEWHPSLKDAMDILTGKTDTVQSYPMWEKESLKSEENPTAPYNTTQPGEISVFLPITMGDITIDLDGIPGGMSGDISGGMPGGVSGVGLGGGLGSIFEFGDVSDMFSDGSAMGSKPRSPIKPVRLSGRLLGGCIDCLNNLVGTRFDKVDEFNKKYADDGVLWFLEACDLGPLDIRRALWHMKSAGWFDKATGFLIGRPMHYGESMMGVDQYNAVTETLMELNVPILMDLDIGHLPPMMPIVCGAYADVMCLQNDLTIVYDLK